MPEVLESVRELLSHLVPPFPAIWELSAAALETRTITAPRSQVPSKGKLAMMLWHRSLTLVGTVLPWLPRSNDLDSEVESYASQRSRHHSEQWYLKAEMS